MENLTTKKSHKYENQLFQKEEVSCERKNIFILQSKSTGKNKGTWGREGNVRLGLKAT
jgi:hypothetical protein